MRDAYIPLFKSVLFSSLWSLSGDSIKVFWTVCLMADPEGYACTSIEGIRRISGLSLKEVERHLEQLESPDPHSKDMTRDPERDGRRLERVANGWRVLNLEWYREEARKQAELARKRKWWNEKGSAARRGARRIETETETETNTPSECSPPTPTRVELPRPDPGTHTVVMHGVEQFYRPPEDLEPDARCVAFAEEFKIDLERVVSKFKGHAFKAPKRWQHELYSWLKQEKTWAERDRARELARKTTANTTRGTRATDIDTGTQGHLRFEPSWQSRDLAKERGVELDRLVARLRSQPRFQKLSTPEQDRALQRCIEKEARKVG